MRDKFEKNKPVTIFGGSFDTEPSRDFLRTLQQRWVKNNRSWENMDPKDIEVLDAMWLAADTARVLTKHHYSLITGGYDMGTMGMADRSARIFGVRYGTDTKRLGVPLPEYFPKDPELKTKKLKARNLPDRLGKLLNSEGFVVLRGAHGTLNEVTTIIEEEDLRDDSTEGEEQLITVFNHYAGRETKRQITTNSLRKLLSDNKQQL